MAPSSAIKWVRRFRETGSAAPGQMGGHKPKAIRGEHHVWLVRRIAPERLVFIDETWTKTNMAPLRGWAPRGARLATKIPHGHWRTMTFLAALRHDRIDAPWLLVGPINGDSFRTYVEAVLVPSPIPGDIVILDNLGSHKGKAIRHAIRSAGAKLISLPKYSPDLNPIEQVFAKLKHLLRKLATRSPDGVCAAIGQLLDALTPREYANDFATLDMRQPKIIPL